jgi:O-antigen/teichoic acid export membrane protein
MCGAINRFALTVLQMQQRHATFSLLEFLRAVLQLALPLTVILIAPGSFLSLSLGSSLGMLIAGLISGATAFSRTVPGAARFTQREFFSFGVPLMVMALVGFGLNNAERLFLEAYYSAGAVAVFAAAYALARQPIDMVANAINMGGFPEIVRRFDTESPDAAAAFLARLMALMMRLCLAVAALLIMLGPYITAIVLPADYHADVHTLFPIIAFSVLCANLTTFVYGAIVHAHKKPWLLVLSNGAGSVATIAFSLLLIPPLAEIGAALALAGGTLAALGTCALVSHRLTPVPVPWRDIAISLVIAVATGGAATLASAALPDVPAWARLIGGGAAGGLMFLALNMLAHPHEAGAVLRRVRARLRTA